MLAGAILQNSSCIEKHSPLAYARKLMLQQEALDLSVLRKDIYQKLPQGRSVSLSAPQIIKDLSFRLLGR